VDEDDKYPEWPIVNDGWGRLGLVGLWFPPGLKLPIRVAVSGFMSMGDCGPILDILGYNIENRSN